VAVLKPWAWNAPPPPVPGSGLGSPAAVGAAVPTPTPAPTPADPLTRSACLVDPIWTTVVDQVAEATSTRSWTRLDPVPAAGPTDPAIATVRVFADAVPRIGFCDPAGVEASPSDGIVADPSPANGAGQVPLAVRVWLVTPAPAPLTALATEIRPELLSGGTVADRGALFGPPASAASGARGAASPAAWPTGRYVFRVDLPGAGPAGSDVTWFAVDLKGPWPWGPGTPRAIGPVVGPGVDPAPSTLASAAPGASGGASPRP